MAPVGHEIPANPPVHNAGEEFGKSLLMRTTRVIVQFSVSNTMSQSKAVKSLKLRPHFDVTY